MMGNAQTPDIIDLLAPGMTFERFLTTCQPRPVKHGMAVLIPEWYGECIRVRRVELAPVWFPDKPHRMFIGQDQVTGDWYYR